MMITAAQFALNDDVCSRLGIERSFKWSGGCASFTPGATACDDLRHRGAVCSLRRRAQPSWHRTQFQVERGLRQFYARRHGL